MIWVFKVPLFIAILDLGWRESVRIYEAEHIRLNKTKVIS